MKKTIITVLSVLILSVSCGTLFAGDDTPAKPDPQNTSGTSNTPNGTGADGDTGGIGGQPIEPVDPK